MNWHTFNERLYEVAEDATTSIGADLTDLSEGEEVETPDLEVESPKGEEEVEVPEEEEVTEEEEEAPPADLHPFERPSIKQLSEAFPDLFKKFPSLKDMYFREAEYSKLYPTIQDAKEANENNTAFLSIRDDVFNGDGSKFFSAIKEVDEKGLERFASGVLPAMFKSHPAAFWRAANPLIEDVARNMFQKGEKEKNESLQNAARYLSDYFFGTTEIAEGKKTSIVKVEVDPEVAKERETFEKQKSDSFRGSISTDIKTQLIAMIEGKDPKSGKVRLDPDGVFSTFIKATIIDSIINDLGSQLQSDKDHIRFMDSLWDKAKRNGRTDADKARIISAYLARAKSLIPTLRSKYVSEALGQKVRTSSQRKEKVETIESRRESGTMGRGSNGNQKNYNPKSINYGKTSDEDILNDNITYK